VINDRDPAVYQHEASFASEGRKNFELVRAKVDEANAEYETNG